jgi:hypothetical protein
MTTHLASQCATALRRAAVRATLAPSVHNTQPWRLQLTDSELRIFADHGRQLKVLDPSGRQLMVSCGCAVMNARVSLARDGLAVQVGRLPDPSDPELLAVLTPVAATGCETDLGDVADRSALAALDAVLELRQTNRRRFADDEVPAAVLDDLEAAALAEGASLYVVRGLDDRVAVAALSQHADAIEHLNPSYRAELRAWTSDSPGRLDGVPHLAVPHVDGTSEDEVPIRDFDTHGDGFLPGATHSSMNQALVLVCTDGDRPSDWLRAGEALERVLLEITRHGFTASPLTQVTEVPSTRAQLRRDLGMDTYPHVLLRIGRAAMTPASSRRRLVDVLVEDA